MNPKEAFEILYQLARAAPVNGDVGDRRDAAMATIKKLVDDSVEKQQEKKSGEIN